MNYRKDISGLRAIAVILVLLFHGKLAWFPSGFIGVDIFFVISGFLITSIIQGQLERGRFSLADFYVRRLWRIQVALLVVVFVTLLLALVFYLPQDLKAYLKSAMDTVGFISNRYFAHATTAYAAPDSEVLLLLHTWSLSIEWQWYLILPLWLMALHRVTSPRVGKCVVAFSTVLMMLAALWITHRDGSSAYYFFTPRVFEFLAGATLALVGRNKPFLPDGWSANVAGVAALAVLLGLSMTPGVIADYPNGAALLVCAACVGVLAVGTREQSWVARLLARGLLVFLGDISYSLYLWHWPIFATARYLGVPEGALLLLLCYPLTLLFAYLSYRFVEEPYRKRHSSLVKSLLMLVLLPLVVVAALYGLSSRMNFWPSRFGPAMSTIMMRLDQATPAQRRLCMQSGAGPMTGVEGCTLGHAPSSQRALMIGDSYSNQSWNFIDVLAKDAGVSVTALSTPSCLVFPGITMHRWWKMNARQYQPCLNHLNEYYARIRSQHYRFVIIGENWLYYEPNSIVNGVDDPQSVALGRQRLEKAIRDGLDVIISTGAIPVLIESPAPMPENFQVCFYQHIVLRAAKHEGVCAIAPQDDANKVWVDAMFARLKISYPTLRLIDPKEAQCAGSVCRVDIDGVPLYRDAGHLTDYASLRLGQLYLRTQLNPLKTGAAPLVAH